MSHSMHRFLKEVGRGKKGARDLTYEEALEVAQLMLSGEATDAQIGAFLQAERIKGETVEELLAFLHQLQSQAQRIPHDFPDLLDTAGPYDGRSKSFMATIVSSLVVAAAGGRVVMHASETLPPKYGVVLSDVLSKLGIRMEHSVEGALLRLQQTGICALATESFCPPLARLRKIREELGIRTLWNTVEKALNLGNATYSILGVFHGAALEKAAELQKHLNFRRSLVVQGMEGSEDIPLHRPSRMIWIEQDSIREIRIDPAAYGMTGEKQLEILTADQQAEHVLAILNNQPDPYYTHSVLNSGIKLWLYGKTPDLQEGIELAKTLLSDGKVRETWNLWKESETA
jgi:anthranilate phosphoribosyltransferase